MRTTYVFDEVKSKRVVEVECSVCEMPRKRTITACQTINPYNLLPDGSLKDAATIRRENEAKLDRLERELKRTVITCKPCQEDKAE